MSHYCGQLWWSIASFKIWPRSFSQVELGGLEPPTPCLQSTHTLTGTVPDVDSCPPLWPPESGCDQDGCYREWLQMTGSASTLIRG
jgi:hypothetical protein